ncbi:MAG TPA: hypothetical protein VGR10_03445, partial [Thermoleophilaceae bacterium]|nr:hypothetical protein [Thermoleophilaceae bacterium]
GHSIAQKLARRLGARATTRTPVPGTKGYRLVTVTDRRHDPEELEMALSKIRRQDTLPVGGSDGW